jgi:hypothetical protein
MKRRFACWLWLFCWVSVVARAELPVAAAVGKRPRLVVLLAVDQLRSDASSG